MTIVYWQTHKIKKNNKENIAEGNLTHLWKNYGADGQAGGVTYALKLVDAVFDGAKDKGSEKMIHLGFEKEQNHKFSLNDPWKVRYYI